MICLKRVAILKSLSKAILKILATPFRDGFKTAATSKMEHFVIKCSILDVAAVLDPLPLPFVEELFQNELKRPRGSVLDNILASFI